MYTHNIDPVLIHIGQFPIYYYSLFFALLFIISYFLGRWYFKRRKEDPEKIDTIFIIAILATVIGARLGHVFFYNWDYFGSHPFEIVKVWQGGLASHGAVIGLIIGAFIGKWLTKTPLLLLGDIFSLCGSLAVILVRLGNFMNGEIVGRITDVKWGVVFPCNGLIRGACDNFARHPVQLYESALGIFLFTALFSLAKNKKNLKPGFLTGIFLVAYFGIRFILEYFKEYDGTIILEPFTNGQILSIPAVLLGFFLIIYSYKKK